MACDWLNKYSLRKQMIILFSISYGVFLLIMVVTCLGTTIGTNNTVKNDAKDALISQINRNVKKVITGNAEWYTEMLNIGKEGFLIQYALAMSDTYRTDYSMGFAPSYFEYGDTYLSKPLETDSRHNKPVSLLNSAYYVPGSSPSEIATFSQALNDTRDKSAHLDTFFRPLYNLNPSFVGAYVGFEQEGLFRHYPGIGTLDTDSDRTYDPRVRGWYTSSKTSPDKVVYTEPYRDFNGKGWMITIANAVKNVENGLLVGVAGADMLIATIKDHIQSITFLKTGKITLFEDTGTVVADKEWAQDPNDAVGMKYSDLKNPSVSSDLWSRIIATQVGQTNSIEGMEIGGKEYLIVVNRLEGFDNKYLLTVFIPEDEITEPIDKIIDKMKKLNTAISVGLCFGFIVAGILVTTCTLWVSKRITRPLDDIGENIQMMVENIGGDDIGDDLFEVRNGFGDEEDELAENYNILIRRIREARNNANQEENPFARGHAFIRPNKKGGKLFPDGLKPPSYDEVMNSSSGSRSSDYSYTKRSSTTRGKSSTTRSTTRSTRTKSSTTKGKSSTTKESDSSSSDS